MPQRDELGGTVSVRRLPPSTPRNLPRHPYTPGSITRPAAFAARTTRVETQRDHQLAPHRRHARHQQLFENRAAPIDARVMTRSEPFHALRTVAGIDGTSMTVVPASITRIADGVVSPACAAPGRRWDVRQVRRADRASHRVDAAQRRAQLRRCAPRRHRPARAHSGRPSSLSASVSRCASTELAIIVTPAFRFTLRSSATFCTRSKRPLGSSASPMAGGLSIRPSVRVAKMRLSGAPALLKRSAFTHATFKGIRRRHAPRSSVGPRGASVRLRRRTPGRSCGTERCGRRTPSTISNASQQQEQAA